MGLQEIRELADKLTARLAEAHGESPDEVAFQQAGRLAHLLEELDLESEAPQDPGFVCLPIEAHDRLREMAGRAEEEEQRVATLRRDVADLARAHVELKQQYGEARARLHAARIEIDRLKADRPDPTRFPIAAPPGREGDRIEPFTPGPMHVAPRIMADPVVHQHLRDLQAEVDALKDRHEEIQRRLTRCEDTHNVTDAAHDNLSDQVKAFAAKLNKLEVQARPRPVETAAAPFTNSPA